MAIKKIINDTLNTPMTRKEFFGRTGGVLLAVAGVTSILHALGGHSGNVASNTATGGYGSTTYGGGTEA
jgi:hypothetical protein